MSSNSSKEEFSAYRRKLPHWRLEGGIYFITWRLHEHQIELNHAERELVVSVLGYFQETRYRLHAYVVMNNQVHVIVKSLAEYELQSVTHSWKSYSANKLQRQFDRKGSIWQRESFDRIIRDEEEYFEKVQYIHDNPFKRWPDLCEYPWMGFPQLKVGKEANKR